MAESNIIVKVVQRYDLKRICYHRTRVECRDKNCFLYAKSSAICYEAHFGNGDHSSCSGHCNTKPKIICQCSCHAIKKECDCPLSIVLSKGCQKPDEHE